MQDRITRLCRKLVWAEDPEVLRAASEKLQEAISERVTRIREHAVGVAIIDRTIDLDNLATIAEKESTDLTRQSAD